MAITKKPKKSSPVDVDALIQKGGSVAAVEPPNPKPSSATASVVLRIPSDLLERIDLAIRARPVKIPRHTWLLEAVVEKLERSS